MYGVCVRVLLIYSYCCLSLCEVIFHIPNMYRNLIKSMSLPICNQLQNGTSFDPLKVEGEREGRKDEMTLTYSYTSFNYFSIYIHEIILCIVMAYIYMYQWHRADQCSGNLITAIYSPLHVQLHNAREINNNTSKTRHSLALCIY